MSNRLGYSLFRALGLGVGKNRRDLDPVGRGGVGRRMVIIFSPFPPPIGR